MFSNDRNRQFRSVLKYIEDNIARGSKYDVFVLARIGFPIWTDEIPTAAVGTISKRIAFKFNPTWWDEQFDQRGYNGAVRFLSAVILHESYHVRLNHFNRMGNRDPKIWNIATDAVINEHLIYSHGWPTFFNADDQIIRVATVIDGYMNNPDTATVSDTVNSYRVNYQDDQRMINEWTAEAVYDYLLDNFEYGDGEGQADGSGIEVGGDRGDDKSRTLPDNKSNLGSDLTDLSDEDAERLSDLVKINCKDDSRRFAGSRYEGTPELRAGVGTVKYRKIAWEKELCDFVNRSIVSVVADTWTRPSRKMSAFYPDVILPAESDDAMDLKQRIHVYIDISGSMDKSKIQRFAAMVKDLPKRNAEYRYALFNTRVIPISEDDLVKGNFNIGGGTSFDAIEKHCIQSDRYPDIVVVMTDGECGMYRCELPSRWCWVIEGTTGYVARAKFHNGKFNTLIDILAA